MRRELATLKEQIQGRDSVVSWSVRDLVALELWLQVFFGSKTNTRKEFEYVNAE